jgi:hypothetical protein
MINIKKIIFESDQEKQEDIPEDLETSLWGKIHRILKWAVSQENLNYNKLQQLSLLSQASWGRLEMKPTENKNKKHKKGTSQRKS